MSKSAILSSSIAKKYWMAFTGLFLCLFLVGHLLGNLQLIFISGEEGKRAFNEYAYFMTHNPAVKVLSYLTYFSILFHAIDGLFLAIKNKKARPQGYAYNNQGANTSTPARMMAVLGTIVLVFISTHMVNFWAKMHFESIPLHTKTIEIPGQMGGEGQEIELYLTTKGDYSPVQQFEVKNETELYVKDLDLKMGEGYKDLHGLVMAFFGKSKPGHTTNDLAGLAVALYVLSMAVLAFHLWHGFSSAFQSLGIRVGSYKNIIDGAGKAFAVIVPLLFAIIPLYIFLS
ncbi:MAG: succinate dehydrogenase cytochrome b subunit [Crocinitomicaceae bacterium]|jgi:succinate dehydrogenase / fumarate reductase cytochrome b subunit|nr:succinate dehydrogenase cytochrome b subunit [Crocinitomicaceae bacterium]